MSDRERLARAEARRARMIISRGEADIGAKLTGLEAFALAARMSREQWLLAGNELPTHSRSDMPIAFVPRPV